MSLSVRAVGQDLGKLTEEKRTTQGKTRRAVGMTEEADFVDFVGKSLDFGDS